MKLKYSITNNGLNWTIITATEAEWLTWKAEADANKWYGDNYNIVSEPYYPVSLDDIRKVRNLMLTDSDRFMLNDCPLPSGVTLDEIKIYRQSLRDLTKHINLDDVETIGIAMAQFPIKPF